MARFVRWTALFFFMVPAAIALAAAPPAADRDGDTIADRDELILGSDPAVRDQFCTLVDDGQESATLRQAAHYDPSKDFLSVECAHAGGNRYLWRVSYPVAPRLEDTVLHLYVDADANPNTGRKGSAASYQGTDYMLSVVGGEVRATAFRPEGNSAPGPVMTALVADRAVLISADVDLQRAGGAAQCGLYVLCHTVSASGDSPRMSDSSRRQAVSVALVSRDKIMRPSDHADNYRVAATFGHDLIAATLAAEGNLVVPYEKLEMDGFSIDTTTTRRRGHVSLDRPGGKVATRPPRAGRYYAGFVMYDDSNDERLVVRIDGSLEGVAVARQNNNRHWLYWLERARDFTGRERVELEAAGTGGKHGVACVVFLANPPEVRPMRYAVENLSAVPSMETPGKVTLSWTTTWPSPTRLEWGADSHYGKVVEADTQCLVHRAVLEGLDPAQDYHARASGVSRLGTAFRSDDFAFRAAGPKPRPTAENPQTVELVVANPHRFDVAAWPVTSGVPFPQGLLASGDDVRLVGPEGEVPLDVATTARWPDGSVKWLLLNFQAAVRQTGQAHYRLEFGRHIRRRQVVDGPVTLRQDGQRVTIDTGAVRFTIEGGGKLTDIDCGGRGVLSPGESCATWALDGEGRLCPMGGGQVAVEEAKPLRAVVKTSGAIIAPDGRPLLRIEQRFEAHRGVPAIRLRHTLVVERAELFTEFQRLWYRVPVQAKGGPWRVPMVDGEVLELAGETRAVRQAFDDQVVATADRREVPIVNRLAGSIASATMPLTVAVRDLWQNYPKGFSLSDGKSAVGLDIDLGPRFAAGAYDRYPFEREGHQLYYYLLNGRYRLKRGVSKTHELLLSFEPAERSRQSARLFQEPLLATAPADWYCGSKAFYDVAPRDEAKFPLYERAIDKNLAAYAAQRERQKDYGMLNYGDWYGERGSNWGNVEYDTQHAFFLEYIRSGNPDAFFLGEATETHNRDIDTVHWSLNPGEVGAVYTHQMCHVGQYFDRSVPGTLGYPSGGASVSHAWTEGHFDHYFLTGDRRSYDTGCAVADYFIRKELGRPYDFSTTRTPGWQLIMLASAYAATGDPYYLNAARVIAEHVLELQDKRPVPLDEHQRQGRRPYQIGGWSRMLSSGHCDCPVKHRGNPGFMIAVLLSGLKYYYDVTGDPRVKESIIQGAHYLLEETYSDQVKGFRYTSCPNTEYRGGASPLMVEGIARAYLWTGDERFRRVLVESLPRAGNGSPYGKSFSMYYRMAPRVLADLEATGIELQ